MLSRFLGWFAWGSGHSSSDADAGLAGLEVDHRDHSPEVRRRLRQVAESLDLLVTGSSDYHGAGKPNLLGECTTAPEVFAEIAARGRTAVVTP